MCKREGAVKPLLRASCAHVFHCIPQEVFQITTAINMEEPHWQCYLFIKLHSCRNYPKGFILLSMQRQCCFWPSENLSETLAARSVTGTHGVRSYWWQNTARSIVVQKVVEATYKPACQLCAARQYCDGKKHLFKRQNQETSIRHQREMGMVDTCDQGCHQHSCQHHMLLAGRELSKATSADGCKLHTDVLRLQVHHWLAPGSCATRFRQGRTGCGSRKPLCRAA